MSTNRRKAGGWADPKRLPKGPNGRNLCRQCGTEVPKGRRTFCSDQCVSDWRIKTDPGHARAMVFERDHGVCSLCGLDAEALRQQYRAFEKEAFGTVRYGHYHPLHLELNRIFQPGNRTSLWDADHILPVVEGGGECDLDNLRTLCLWCHRQVTAELKRRLAERRKAEKGQAALFGREAGAA